MDDRSYTIHVPKRWVRVALIVAITALIVAPLTAVATHSFNDVPNDNTFHGDIAWLKDADVTKGCNPPANTLYCPKDFVTREQMAAFMRRLAENKVVDAATAVTAETAGHAAQADSATTANMALDVANDVPGVALAGAHFRANGSVATWFNRFGGQPTVSTPSTGRREVTIPGLGGRLGQNAIVTATTAGFDCLVRQFGAGSNNLVIFITRDRSTGDLTNNCEVNFVVNAANDAGVAMAGVDSGAPSNDQLEEAGG